MVECSPINVIPKDLVNTFFDKDLKCFKFSKLQYMPHRPLGFLQIQQWPQIGWECDSRYRHFAHDSLFYSEAATSNRCSLK